MEVYNLSKNEQLGMTHGKAVNRLRKLVLFDLLKRHNENICFRCNKEIINVNQLSMDHKEPWLYNNIELFWDLNNIAFSHTKCNYSNSRKNLNKEPIVIQHGTYSGYASYNCRCFLCREAGNEYKRGYRRKIKNETSNNN
jgi:hypothetical protein